MAQRAKAPCFVHSFFGLGPTSLTSLTGICLPDIWLRHCQLPSLSHSSFRTCWDWALFSLCHQLLSVPLTLSSWLCPRPGGDPAPLPSLWSYTGAKEGQEPWCVLRLWNNGLGRLPLPCEAKSPVYHDPISDTICSLPLLRCQICMY